MLKNDPVAPSARNHRVCGAVTPALSWPPAKTCSGREKYIARSTMIGTLLSEWIAAETSVAASPGTSSTWMVWRLFAATV